MIEKMNQSKKMKEKKNCWNNYFYNSFFPYLHIFILTIITIVILRGHVSKFLSMGKLYFQKNIYQTNTLPSKNRFSLSCNSDCSLLTATSSVDPRRSQITKKLRVDSFYEATSQKFEVKFGQSKPLGLFTVSFILVVRKVVKLYNIVSYTYLQLPLLLQHLSKMYICNF